jgi:hypothetical protein
MQSFAEFETAFLAGLQQERSDLQGLHSASEAQLSAWIENLFRIYLGYTHWKEITREGSAWVGSKGSKQLFPDLRIEVQDNGLIFVECKRLGRLDGAKGQVELNDGVGQLRTYIRAHLDQATIKPKTVLGVVTDGNRWHLMGLNRANEFHTIAEWTFLTDDPRLIAQRLWLLAKPALAQPTSALVEFLARRTLSEVLKDNTKWLTKKVNENLPDGNVSEDLISKWLRDAFSDPIMAPRMVQAASPMAPSAEPLQPPSQKDEEAPKAQPESTGDSSEPVSRRIAVSDLLNAGLLMAHDLLVIDGAEGRQQTATITPEGKINVAGQIFDSVSPAALRALELAGKSRKAINGWREFRVLRAGNQLGTLLEIRGQYEDKQQQESTDAGPEEEGPHSTEGQDAAVLGAVDRMKPLLALLPELTVNPSKSTISLYAGKLVIGYAYPRKKGLPRLRIYVGERCPKWATSDSTYEAWCYADDWGTNLNQVVALLRAAPGCRSLDMTAGRDAYRRRTQPPASTLPFAAG